MMDWRTIIANGMVQGIIKELMMDATKPQDLQEWARQIVADTNDSVSTKLTDDEELRETLLKCGVKLDHMYAKELSELKPEERAQLLDLFKKVAEGTPEERLALYARLAAFYDQLAGWEGGKERDRGLRGWLAIL